MSKNATTYTVFINDTAGENRSRKSKAIELAEQALAFDPARTVEVRTNAGTVVWPTPEAFVDQVEAKDEADAEAKAASNRSKPGTRTETPNFEFPEIKGFEPAYVRANVKAVVFRGEGGYLVVTVKDGAEVTREEAANTTEARVITNRLAAEHKAARDAEKEAEKAKKDAAKAKKDADREAKKVADQEAKDKRAADKEAARLEKEAAAAATEQPEAVEAEADATV